MLAGMLPQCTALTELDLSFNEIGIDRANTLAGVLPQCPAMAYLYLSGAETGTAGAVRLVLPTSI